MAHDQQGTNEVMEEGQEGVGKNIQLRLMNFPISFFAMIMGLSGFTIAIQRVEMILKPPVLSKLGLSNYLFGFVVVLFVIILIIYLIKLVMFPGEVVKEINHPVRLSFFPAISISLLLFSIIAFKIDHFVSLVLWGTGASLHLIFTIYIISVWIQHVKFQISHFSAAWFIPVVGNILIPISGTEHGFYQISWFFFSIGVVFWIILMTILFNRLFFHQPLPERLIPTMFIMIAPPAVGFISYAKLNHEHLDQFALILYYFALFLFILLASQIKMFSSIKFYLSWWAYSFPIAAITIATTFMYKLTKAACAGGVPHGSLPMVPAVPVAAAAPAVGPAIPVAPIAQVVPITSVHTITTTIPMTSPIPVAPITATVPVTSVIPVAPITATVPVTSVIPIAPTMTVPPVTIPTIPAPSIPATPVVPPPPIAPVVPPAAPAPHIAECAYTSMHILFFQSLAYVLLGLITLIIVMLLTRTLIGVMRGEICVEEG